jgi:hypothetical protein
MSVVFEKLLLSFIRGGLIPLFLLLYFDISYSEDNHEATMNRIIKTATEKNLHKSYIWKSLLQVTNDKVTIKDPSFILSRDNFSLENELVKTIQSFFDVPNDSHKHPICRFPARFYWIKSELGLDDGIFPAVRCPEFEEYLNRAPAEKIYVVFVSENVSQPSSMMGHVFLKLSGHDHKSNYVEHAVSFYTIIDSANIPLLIIKSTITGMNGFFSLLPYREQIKRYLEVEDRNVWEYELDLSEKNKKLIYYHIWELRDLKMNYLFTGYNCATVIYNILSLSSENFLKDKHRLWITPKDVVKTANRNNLIIGTKIIPSDKWNIRMLSEALDNDSVDRTYDLFKNKNFEHVELSDDITKRLYQGELIRSYSNYLYTQAKIDKKELNTINNEINRATEKDMPSNSTYYIDLSQYKSPLKTFDDSQLGLGYRRGNGRNYMKLYFLPASNSLTDDNREYFNENFLKLGEISVLLTEKSIKLESFQLYAMKSLIPWNKFVKGISGEFRLGLEEHYDKELKNHLAMNASGGIGLTKKISADINTYLLMNAGLGYGKSHFYLSAYPEVGATIYEILNMKTNLSYKYIYNQLGSNDFYHNFDITQSVFWHKKFKLSATFEHRFNNCCSDDAYELMVYVYF